MTKTDLIKLSERVAELYGVPAYCCATIEPFALKKYLHESLARVMRLAIENGLSVEQVSIDGKPRAFVSNGSTQVSSLKFECDHQDYADHNNDKAQATIVAIMKALIALKGSEG